VRNYYSSSWVLKIPGKKFCRRLHPLLNFSCLYNKLIILWNLLNTKKQ
jgi:hypothetical protein